MNVIREKSGKVAGNEGNNARICELWMAVGPKKREKETKKQRQADIRKPKGTYMQLKRN